MIMIMIMIMMMMIMMIMMIIYNVRKREIRHSSAWKRLTLPRQAQNSAGYPYAVYIT